MSPSQKLLGGRIHIHCKNYKRLEKSKPVFKNREILKPFKGHNFIRNCSYCHVSPSLTKGRIHLQHTRIAVAFARWNCLLFFSSKTIKTSKGEMRRLYAYAANECAQSLFNTHLLTQSLACLLAYLLTYLEKNVVCPQVTGTVIA